MYKAAWKTFEEWVKYRILCGDGAINFSNIQWVMSLIIEVEREAVKKLQSEMKERHNA